MKVIWDNKKTYKIIHPFWPDEIKKKAKKIPSSYFPSSIWIPSSQSSSLKTFKWIVLSKKAILLSASKVNQHLNVSSKDIWLQALPNYHIGGLSIEARAFLSSSKIKKISFSSWDIFSFLKDLKKNKISLVSLVPFQARQIIEHQLKAPSSLRCVLLGGGSISKKDYQSLRKLFWPIIPTYGMTEVSSQIATANLNSLKKKSFPELDILDHVKCKTDKKNNLFVQSESLCSALIYLSSSVKIKKIKKSSFFQTEDQVKIKKSKLSFLNRKSDLVKIKGRFISLKKIKDDFRNKALFSFEILVYRDKITLFVPLKEFKKAEEIALKMNQKSSSLEKIDLIYGLTHWPKTSIGKISKSSLFKLIET